MYLSLQAMAVGKSSLTLPTVFNSGKDTSFTQAFFSAPYCNMVRQSKIYICVHDCTPYNENKITLRSYNFIKSKQQALSVLYSTSTAHHIVTGVAVIEYEKAVLIRQHARSADEAEVVFRVPQVFIYLNDGTRMHPALRGCEETPGLGGYAHQEVSAPGRWRLALKQCFHVPHLQRSAIVMSVHKVNNYVSSVTCTGIALFPCQILNIKY